MNKKWRRPVWERYPSELRLIKPLIMAHKSLAGDFINYALGIDRLSSAGQPTHIPSADVHTRIVRARIPMHGQRQQTASTGHTTHRGIAPLLLMQIGLSIRKWSSSFEWDLVAMHLAHSTHFMLKTMQSCHSIIQLMGLTALAGYAEMTITFVPICTQQKWPKLISLFSKDRLSADEPTHRNKTDLY